MSQQYSIQFKNNSSNPGYACIYQTDPDIGVPNVLSLAWFSKYAFPSTNIIFKWEIDYNFVWSQTGTLEPGVTFIASQAWDADLSSNNQVTFTHENDTYTFKNKTADPRSGSLYIKEDGTLPLKEAAVGIGMSGNGTFVVQAQPNMNLTFTPHPKYWIAFGNYTEGQVLDITEMTNVKEIDFPPNTYSMTAILNADNSWTVQTTETGE